MNELKVFENEEFGRVRTTIVNGEPFFVGKDVALALGYSDPSSAIAKKVDKEDRGIAKMATPSGHQNMTTINESGLYALIIGSKLESAKKFKRWITSEVIPSIRKNGGYIAGQTEMTPEQLMSKALVLAQNILKERDEKIRLQNEEIIEQTRLIETMQPKVNYVDEILKSKNTVLVTQIAQDYGMSAATFNKKLHSLGVQRKVGDQWILYADHQGNGYVHSVTIPYRRNDGSEGARMQTEWTQKGRLFLYELLKKNDILPQIER